MSQLSNPPTDARRVMPVYMTVTAPCIQISNNELCTQVTPIVLNNHPINSTGITDMKPLIIFGLLICPTAFAGVPSDGPEVAALKFNHWYMSQLAQDKNPQADYEGLRPYVTSNTITALKKSNSADPNIEDAPDADMFIKAQDWDDDWQQIEIVSSDYDPVCMQIYVSFGVKQKHTVIDCMVKEDGAWKVQSVAGQAILRNVSLK
ncbi:DUF3828 domain-containing protein [Salmonella bongori]|nr:hypothetical protein [Salmonella bongori]EDP8622406.1 DUF3828 domain-containing protein [Salmonella bongori]